MNLPQKNPNRAVVRIDQRVIETSEGFLNRDVIANLVRQIDELRKKMEIIVVTSGTVAAGREVRKQPKHSNESRVEQRVLSTLGSTPLHEIFNALSAAHTRFIQVLTSQENMESIKEGREMTKMIDAILREDSVPLVMDNLATTNKGFKHPHGLARIMATITKAEGIMEVTEDHRLKPVTGKLLRALRSLLPSRPKHTAEEPEPKRKTKMDKRTMELERRSIGGQYFETETRLTYGYYKLAPGSEPGTYFMRCTCCSAIGERVTAKCWREFDSQAAYLEEFANTLATFLSSDVSDSGCEEEQLLTAKTDGQLTALIEHILAADFDTDNLIPPSKLEAQMKRANKNADKQNYKFMKGRAAAEEGLDESAGSQCCVLLNETQDALVRFQIVSLDNGCALNFEASFLVGDQAKIRSNNWLRVKDRQEALQFLLTHAREHFEKHVPIASLDEHKRMLQLEAQKGMNALLANLQPSDLEQLPVISDERFDHEQRIRIYKGALRSFPEQRKEIERDGRKELGDELFDKILAELQGN